MSCYNFVLGESVTTKVVDFFSSIKNAIVPGSQEESRMATLVQSIKSGPLQKSILSLGLHAMQVKHFQIFTSTVSQLSQVVGTDVGKIIQAIVDRFSEETKLPSGGTFKNDPLLFGLLVKLRYYSSYASDDQWVQTCDEMIMHIYPIFLQGTLIQHDKDVLEHYASTFEETLYTKNHPRNYPSTFRFMMLYLHFTCVRVLKGL